MKKIYLDLKVVSGVRDAYRHNAKSLMNFSGANIGNFAFRYGLSSLTDLSGYAVMAYAEVDRAISIEQPAMVLVSCANWLSNTPDYERSNGVRAAIFDRIQAPVVSFGLGAQAPHGAEKLELGPNTIRLAQVLASKCKLLSVRDEFTAGVVNDIGIKNVVITGCPSNFANLEQGLGARIRDYCRSVGANVSVWSQVRSHISEYSGGHALSGKVLASTIKVMHGSPAFYVVQSPVLMPFLLRESREVPPDYAANAPEMLRAHGGAGMAALLRRSALHFSSIEAWMDFARTCDIAFGMRIHGSMIPLQAGTPSVVIGHDSRTAGLASFMGIPTMSPQEFLDACDAGPRRLFEVVDAGMEGYDARRLVLARTMVDYLEGNGVACSNALLDFCA